MNFLQSASLILLGSTLSFARMDERESTIPQLGIEFYQSAQDSIIHLNPAYQQELEKIIPFQDTTNTFFLHYRNTNSSVATSRNVEVKKVTDVTTFVNDVLYRKSGKKDSVLAMGNVIAIHAHQTYGLTDKNIVTSVEDSEANYLKAYINKAQGIQVVTLSEDGYKIEDYDLSSQPDMRQSFMNQFRYSRNPIEFAEVSPEQILINANIKPARQEFGKQATPKTGVLINPLSMDNVADFNMDKDYRIQNILTFR